MSIIDVDRHSHSAILLILTYEKCLAMLSSLLPLFAFCSCDIVRAVLLTPFLEPKLPPTQQEISSFSASGGRAHALNDSSFYGRNEWP